MTCQKFFHHFFLSCFSEDLPREASWCWSCSMGGLHRSIRLGTYEHSVPGSTYCVVVVLYLFLWECESVSWPSHRNPFFVPHASRSVNLVSSVETWTILAGREKLTVVGGNSLRGL